MQYPEINYNVYGKERDPNNVNYQFISSPTTWKSYSTPSPNKGGGLCLISSSDLFLNGAIKLFTTDVESDNEEDVILPERRYETRQLLADNNVKKSQNLNEIYDTSRASSNNNMDHSTTVVIAEMKRFH